MIKCTTRKNGFTIIEMLLVIMILSILYTIAAYNLSGLQSEARIARAKGDLKVIKLAVTSFVKNRSACPPEQTYQTSLILAIPQLLDRNLMDPFGATMNTLYSYTVSNNQKYYIVYSVGEKRNGYTAISDDGVILIEGSVIYETNGYL